MDIFFVISGFLISGIILGGKHTLAGAGFASNLVLWDEVGYFDVASAAKPLLHLWSALAEPQRTVVATPGRYRHGPPLALPKSMLNMFKQTALVKWIAATLFVATTATVLAGCIVDTAPNHRYYHSHNYHRGY